MRKPNIGKPRPPGTFSLIPLTLFCCVTLTVWWIATQRLAAELGYQPELGPPWLKIWSLRLYLPWKVLSWNYWYHVYAPRQFWRALALVYGGVFLGVIAVICYAVWQARRARIAATHGTARWGDARDAKPAGCLNGRGVVLGKLPDGQYLQHDGPEHVISIAPTRSGKGVGQIIPTLLTWPESVVVHDFKAENWAATSGARARFSHCLYFNPVELESCHYNPLTEIRPGVNLIKDTQNVAQMIVDPDGKGLVDHWAKTSCSLLVGAILHVLYCEPDKSLAGIAAFLADPRRDTVSTLRLMWQTKYPDPVARKVIQSVAREMLNKDSRELSAVVSTAMSYLGLYRDPLVAANTADSDFSILDLLESDYPVSLYLVVPPSDTARLMPLMRLMWSQIGGRLTERLKRKGRRHRVLLMLDELPSLGKLEFIQHSLAFIAGYGIKAFLVAQSKKQLEEVYGKNHSIVDNCQVRTFFTPNDIETAQEISTMLGMKTEVHQQKMYTGHRLSPWLAHVMVSDQETARPLLTPGEVLTFPDDEAIVFVTGRPPLRALKIQYFDDATFAERVLGAPKLQGTRPYPLGPARRGNPWSPRATRPGATPDAQRPPAADADAAKASTPTPVPPTTGSESETREAAVELPGWAAASDGGVEGVPEVLREDELEVAIDGREALRDSMRRAEFDRQDSQVSPNHSRDRSQLGLDL
ncbi:MAG TPA: IncP-type conjugal transfer protein TraG [Gemmatimonadales bacterium]|nr:IncP-type conjugal transfer protein TraG [Gemmatimonadales bacterium]